MKIAFCLSLALLTTACSTVERIFPPGPQIVEGDDQHVVLHDPKGDLNLVAAKDRATKYCNELGKTAHFEALGGAPMDCVSKQLPYCVTYRCD